MSTLADAAPGSSIELPPTKGDEKSRVRLRELPVLALIALAAALLVKSFIIQAFYIPSESMEPTLVKDDRVLVNELSFGSDVPERGDVVVFLNPSLRDRASQLGFVGGVVDWFGEGLGVARPEDEHYIKRVIGLPGDIVRVDAEGVTIDGERLQESYVAEQGGLTGAWEVPAGSVFVMGDNRAHSGDSRIFGPITVDSIVGTAFVRVWPPDRFASLS